MSSRVPEKPSDAEAEGIPDPGFANPGQLEAGSSEAVLEPPHDAPLAADEFGSTAAEQRDGESLDGRLAREEEDVLSAVTRAPDERAGSDTPFAERSGQGVGRIVQPDEGARSDTEADMVAVDAGTDLGGYTAEEAAMHLEPEV